MNNNSDLWPEAVTTNELKINMFAHAAFWNPIYGHCSSLITVCGTHDTKDVSGIGSAPISRWSIVVTLKEFYWQFYFYFSGNSLDQTRDLLNNMSEMWPTEHRQREQSILLRINCSRQPVIINLSNNIP
jgi:hypothetical protein